MRDDQKGDGEKEVKDGKLVMTRRLPTRVGLKIDKTRKTKVSKVTLNSQWVGSGLGRGFGI